MRSAAYLRGERERESLFGQSAGRAVSVRASVGARKQ